MYEYFLVIPMNRARLMLCSVDWFNCVVVFWFDSKNKNFFPANKNFFSEEGWFLWSRGWFPAIPDGYVDTEQGKLYEILVSIQVERVYPCPCRFLVVVPCL